jgi:ribosome production factor 2
MVELLLLTQPSGLEQTQPKLQIGVELKPLILFAGSQWDDPSSTSQSSLFRTLKSMFLDIFSGEEVTSVDVGGLQYLLLIATGEPSPAATTASTPETPTIHLRWYTLRTIRSATPKLPRVELDPAGPTFDFRVGRFKEADENVMKEALKRARGPNEARTKKNIETDLVGDKIGRVHLGKQDLKELQTRKMKGLKRGRDEDDEGLAGGEVNEDSDVDMENGGMDLDEASVSGSESEEDGSEDIEFVDEDGEDDNDEEDEKNHTPKRQRLV